MKKSDKPDNRPALADEAGKLTRREGLLTILRCTDAQNSVASLEIVDNGKNEFVYLLQHPHYVVDASMRSVDENAVGQTQLSQAVQPLHGGRVKNLQFGSREPLIAI